MQFLHGMSLRIDVIDDDPQYRESIARLLRMERFEVETFAAAEELLERERTPAACVVVDLRLPGQSGLELQESLGERWPELPIVFVSGSEDVRSGVRAMRQGAVDFLAKPFDARELLESVSRAIAQGDRRRQEREEREAARARMARLTPCERQVVDHVARGLLNKQIAAEIGRSEHTVKLHRGNAVSKLGVGSVPELVRLIDLAES